MLKAAEWEESDLKKIIALLPGRNDRYRKIGDFYVLGGGFSHHATSDILQNGYDLKDKALQKQFIRAANYAADTQLASFYMNGVGGSAMYNPDIRALMYSVMSRADLNAFTHEVSHARFHRFQEHLQKWLKEKKYALPFQLDGSKALAWARKKPMAEYLHY